MQNKILENVKITPNEVKEYFEKIPKDSLFFYESEVEVSQIVMYPKANKDVEDFVTAQLLDMKRQVESGQKNLTHLPSFILTIRAVRITVGSIVLTVTINRGILLFCLRHLN